MMEEGKWCDWTGWDDGWMTVINRTGRWVIMNDGWEWTRWDDGNQWWTMYGIGQDDGWDGLMVIKLWDWAEGMELKDKKGWNDGMAGRSWWMMTALLCLCCTYRIDALTMDAWWPCMVIGMMSSPELYGETTGGLGAKSSPFSRL